jgi:hypothetical protein
LLRSNIKSDDPGHLWRLYLQLVEVERIHPLYTPCKGLDLF